MSKKVLVVGGGAAGMMASIFAARSGAEVTLFEPNDRLGMKLNITGKGRCNVTNASNCEELLANVATNARFLYSAFRRFDGADAMAFFEELGVPLKIERGKRVFPCSDRSFDISGALEKELRRLSVTVRKECVEKLLHTEDQVIGVRTASGDVKGNAVILATGGLSYPKTGSTGDGLRMAEQMGHTVMPPMASLVPIVCAEEDCGRMQGLSLKNVTLTVWDAKSKKVYSELGEMLFTHFGVSGPLVLSASAHMRHFEKGNYRLSIDLKPALSEEKLEARLLRDFQERCNQNYSGVLGGLVNRSMIPIIAERTGIPSDKKVNSITKEERRRLLHVLKDFTLTATMLRPVEEAIITSGGIKASEIDPHTMESKCKKNLYFCGEMMDVDAYTGGFNLQIAWASGKAAGESAGEDKGEKL